MSRHDYLPFGEEIGAGVGSRTTTKAFGQSDNVRQKYAGMETDTATGMAHTLWRKQDNWSGRWTSPDPYGGSMSTANPQTFNRYVYCDNDPTNKIDPSGLYLSDIGVYQTDDPSMASPDWTAQKARQAGNSKGSGTPITIGGGSRAIGSSKENGGNKKGSAGEHGGPHGGPQDDSHGEPNGIEPNYVISSDQGGSKILHPYQHLADVPNTAEITINIVPNDPASQVMFAGTDNEEEVFLFGFEVTLSVKHDAKVEYFLLDDVGNRRADHFGNTDRSRPPILIADSGEVPAVENRSLTINVGGVKSNVDFTTSTSANTVSVNQTYYQRVGIPGTRLVMQPLLPIRYR